MSRSHVRCFTALTTLLTALIVPGCDDGASTPTRLAAVTPDRDVAQVDRVAGMSLELADSATIELADGEVVDLELSDEQRAALECDGDVRLSQWLMDGPLTLGERSFAAPVLEVACDGEGAPARVSLREADEADDCITFAPETADSDELQLSAAGSVPAAGCDAVGTRVCLSCGIKLFSPRTVTSVIYTQGGQCFPLHSYGPCTPICGE